MYCLSEKQIDFILNDIRARGVELESLQLNLLDHICCIVEQNLEADGNFENFYAATIKTFYKKELREIEEETINLLTYKNYYAMKKIMIISGAISAILLSLGILFKFQHWQGASFFLVLGISSFSLIFLPLVFTLKAKEKQAVKDKIIVALGTLAASLLSMGILFKIMHWPGANVTGLAALAIMIFLFLPIFFFSGIRNPETKINTFVSSILIIGGCGIFLSLVRSPAGTRQEAINATSCFLRNEQILETEQKQVERDLKISSANAPETSKQINALCEELKMLILTGETGQKYIETNFIAKNTLISDGLAENYFNDETGALNKLVTLKKLVAQYNQTNAGLARASLQTIPDKVMELNLNNNKVLTALNNLIQIQMTVLQNERELAVVN